MIMTWDICVGMAFFRSRAGISEIEDHDYDGRFKRLGDFEYGSLEYRIRIADSGPGA